VTGRLWQGNLGRSEKSQIAGFTIALKGNRNSFLTMFLMSIKNIVVALALIVAGVLVLWIRVPIVTTYCGERVISDRQDIVDCVRMMTPSTTQSWLKSIGFQCRESEIKRQYRCIRLRQETQGTRLYRPTRFHDLYSNGLYVRFNAAGHITDEVFIGSYL
jgi:hypothetical protein